MARLLVNDFLEKNGFTAGKPNSNWSFPSPCVAQNGATVHNCAVLCGKRHFPW